MTNRRPSKLAKSIAETDLATPFVRRPWRLLAALCSLGLVLAIAPQLASAQSAEAEALFRQGKELFAQGKIPEACDALDASNKVEARAGTLILLGECREKNDQLASAWSAFADAKTRAKDPAKKSLAEKRAAALEPRLSYLTISVPDESRVDGLTITRDGVAVDPALWNRAVPVDGKKYQVVGKAPGHEAWSTEIIVPIEHGKSTVDVPKFKELKIIVNDKEQKLGANGQPIYIEEPSIFTPRRKIAAGVGAAGLVAIGVASVFAVQKGDLENQAHSTCPDPNDCAMATKANKLLKQAKTKALVANIGYGVGAAAVVGAVVLWYLSPPESSGPAIDSEEPAEDAEEARRLHLRPSLSPAYVGLDLSLGF